MFPQFLLDSCERVMSDFLFWHLHIIHWHHFNSGEMKELREDSSWGTTPPSCLHRSCLSLATGALLFRGWTSGRRRSPNGTWTWALLSSGNQAWDIGWTATGAALMSTRRLKGKQKCRVLGAQRVWGREEGLDEGKEGQDKNEERDVSNLLPAGSHGVCSHPISLSCLTLPSCVCQSLCTSIGLCPCLRLFL